MLLDSQNDIVIGDSQNDIAVADLEKKEPASTIMKEDCTWSNEKGILLGCTVNTKETLRKLALNPLVL